MIRAVLFDCDGLMFDTEIVANAIWKYEADIRHVRLPDDFYARITGTGGKDLQAYLESIPGMTGMLAETRKKRFDLDFWGSVHTDCLNRPGLIELFDWLEEHGYRCAICSSSPRSYVETLLSTVSKKLKYDAIVGGDMVKHAKPDPEIFLVGAQALGVQPEECLVLEDSKFGILAAKAAGMHSCFIPDTIIPDEEMRNAIEYERSDLHGVISLLAGYGKEEGYELHDH